MMAIRGDNLDEATVVFSHQKVDDTRKLFSYLLHTHKNLSLYPENHDITKDYIHQLYVKLYSYMGKYGDVTIDIERERVICQDIEVHSGLSEEGTLTHTLFRDGIEWLQINEGIDPEELHRLLSITEKHSVLAKEPQGDVVTDFWEARFEHVQYKAVDFFSQQPQTEPASTSGSETIPSDKKDRREPKQIDRPAVFAGPAIHPEDFALTPDEIIQLQIMVGREESASAVEHLSMLLDMLMQYQDEQDFNTLLDVLRDEFKSSFVHHDFESGMIILDGIIKVLDSKRLRATWAEKNLRSFYNLICSDADCLSPLKDIWSILTVPQAEKLKFIFQHLQPPVLGTMIKLLTSPQIIQLQQILENAILSIILKDTACLVPLIDETDETVLEKLFPVLSRLDTDLSSTCMTRLVEHSSAVIRRKAVKEFFKTGADVSKLFGLIDDEDASIRRMVLKDMSRTRNAEAENFLLQYLHKKKINTGQHEQVMECFKALGRCGSSLSVPFLRKSLMTLNLMGGSKASACREGAAFALAALNIPESQQTIKDARRSLRPGLRKIVREAEKQYRKQK